MIRATGASSAPLGVQGFGHIASLPGQPPTSVPSAGLRANGDQPSSGGEPIVAKLAQCPRCRAASPPRHPTGRHRAARSLPQFSKLSFGTASVRAQATRMTSMASTIKPAARHVCARTVARWGGDAPDTVVRVLTFSKTRRAAGRSPRAYAISPRFCRTTVPRVCPASASIWPRRVYATLPRRGDPTDISVHPRLWSVRASQSGLPRHGNPPTPPAYRCRRPRSRPGGPAHTRVRPEARGARRNDSALSSCRYATRGLAATASVIPNVASTSASRRSSSVRSAGRHGFSQTRQRIIESPLVA